MVGMSRPTFFKNRRGEKASLVKISLSLHGAFTDFGADISIVITEKTRVRQTKKPAKTYGPDKKNVSTQKRTV